MTHAYRPEWDCSEWTEAVWFGFGLVESEEMSRRFVKVFPPIRSHQFYLNTSIMTGFFLLLLNDIYFAGRKLSYGAF